MCRKPQTLLIILCTLMVLLGACKKKKNEQRPAALKPTITDFSPKLGKRGSSVTLTGQNFGDDISVKINGVPVAINQKSSTQVVITVPNDEAVIGGKFSITTKGETLESATEFEVTDIWVKLAPINNLPGRYSGHITFMYKDKIYWGFGDRGSGGLTNEMWSYDTKTFTYTQIATHDAVAANRPLPRKEAAYVVYHDKLYLFSGKKADGDHYNEIWEYTFNTNTWIKKNSVSYAVQAFVINDRIYTQNISYFIHSYDPILDQDMVYWDNLPPKQHYKPVVINNKVYFVGGRGFAAHGTTDKQIFEVDIANKILTKIDIPGLVTNDVSRELFALGTGKKILFGGGQVTWLLDTYTDNYYLFNIENRELTHIGRTPDDPFIAPYGTVDGTLYILCKTGFYKYKLTP